MGEDFRVFGEEDVSGGFAADVLTVRSGVVAHGEDGYAGILRGAAVVDGEGFVEILVEALGGLGVDGDSGGRAGPAADVDGSGDVALGVLVGDVGGVAAAAAVDSGAAAVADAIEGVAEFHAGHACAGWVILFAGDDLSHGVIAVMPFAAVFKQGFGAAVEEVVGVGVGGNGLPAVGGTDGGEAFEEIEGGGGGQARGAAAGGGVTGDEGGVGGVGVGGGFGAGGDGLEAGGCVIGPCDIECGLAGVGGVGLAAAEDIITITGGCPG